MKKINTVCAYIAGVMISISALLMLIDTCGRYFFNSPSSYIPDISGFLILGAIFFGAGFSFQSGAQVYIEIVVDVLKPLPRKICLTIGNIMALVFVVVLMNECWKLAVKAFVSKWTMYGYVQLPTVILYGTMIFGCVFMLLSVAMGVINLWKKQPVEVDK